MGARRNGRNLLYRRALRKGLNLQNDPVDRFAKRGNPAREGSPLLAGYTDYPFTEQVKTVYWRSVMVIVCCRLSAGRSLTKGSDLYAYPAGTSFCSCKRKQNTLGETPRPPTLGCAGYGYYFSAAAEKQIRTARRCAPKVACGGIFIARALEREGRTTSPLPSSKEGNYGSNGQILCNLLNGLRGEQVTANNPLTICLRRTARIPCRWLRRRHGDR